MVTRAEIEQAKKDVQQAEEQIDTSQAQVAEAQEKVVSELGKLKPRKRIPFTPRKERLSKQLYKRQLGKTQVELTAADKQLLEKEAEIQKYKKEVLAPADAQLKAIEDYNSAVETVKKFASKGKVHLLAFWGEGLVKSLAKDYLRMENHAKEAFRNKVAEFEMQNPNEKLLVDWDNMRVTGVESGAFQQSMSLDNYNKMIAELNKSLGSYTMYDQALPAYYDPLTGKQVLQSMDPNIAKQMGYVPVELQGYNPTTGASLIKSETGLLTPQQLAVKQFNEAIMQQSTPLPTTFEIGGNQTKEPFNVDAFINPTPYDIAMRSAPYSEQNLRAIDYQRLGPEGFYQKYGYDVTPEGEILGSGAVSPVINLGPTKREDESLWQWYKRYLKDPESTESALNVALAFGGGKAAYSLARGGGRAALSQVAASGGSLLSDPITQTTSNIVDSIIGPSPTGFSPSGAPSQIGRGALFYAVGSNPLVGSAYLTSIVRSAIYDPVGTVKQVKDYVVENPYEIATVGGLSRAELRIRQRIARSKMYYDIVDKLETQYGTRSPEVINFQKAWRRAFTELPKRTDVIKKWTSKDLEVIAGDKKLTRILDEINSKYKPEVIGTTTITPQTTLRELPRGKAGDIDVQNVPALLGTKSKQMAYEIYNKLKQEGYNVRITEGSFYGNPKYYITLNGKELINIGTSTDYFLKTQLGPLRDLFEFERIGQFRTDPETGVRISGIRGQLRVKLAKGYGGDTSRIRQLKKLLKENKLVGREKDIIDALGITEGTEYLFEGGKYIGERYRLSPTDLLVGTKEVVVSSVRRKITQFDDLLTGRKTGPKDYGYYDNIPVKRRRAISKPSYEKPSYDPSNYLIAKYPKPKYSRGKAPYKKPPYNPSNYLTPQYPTPKTPYKRKTPYKKPPYTPTNYLIPQYGPPKKPPYKKPPYSPPKKPPVDPFQNMLIIRERPRRKPKQTKKKKKKPTYRTLPTLSQQIIGFRLGRTVRMPTGFEIARV